VPLHLVAANIGKNQTLPANGSIELAFDRLLLPLSVSRQTFVLEDIKQTVALTPSVTYDPVARIVTITPMSGDGTALTVGQTYQLTITAPQNAADANGLRAIDGALLDPSTPTTLAFMVTDAAPQPAPINIDFCRDISPIFGSCLLSSCHEAPQGTALEISAEGLVLDPPQYIAQTAIGRVAQEANTGPRSVGQPASRLFGEDMPIVDSTGNASNSWLMYKVLLAAPSPEAVVVVDSGTGADATAEASTDDDAGSDAGGVEAGEAEAGLGDAGESDSGMSDASADAGAKATVPTKTVIPPVDVSTAHRLPFVADSDADRAVLSQYVQGMAMPFPGSGYPPLKVSDLERLNLWIAQGAPTVTSCSKH
jgi:hypothetical protein